MALLSRIEYKGKSYSPFQVTGANNYYQKNGIIAKFPYFLKEQDFYTVMGELLIFRDFSSVENDILKLSQSSGHFSISKDEADTLIIK